jgi:hypothetical protein
MGAKIDPTGEIVKGTGTIKGNMKALRYWNRLLIFIWKIYRYRTCAARDPQYFLIYSCEEKITLTT